MILFSFNVFRSMSFKLSLLDTYSIFSLVVIIINFEILCIGASKDLASHVQTKLKRTAEMDKSVCAVPSWEGDSLCDDINNNEGCNWDGGDCCPPHSWTFWNLFCEVNFSTLP